MVRVVILAACCALASTLACAAQSEFDPLRRAEDEESASLRWELAGGYTPYGTEGTGLDGDGQPYRFIRFVDERTISLSASITLGSSHKLGATAADTTSILRERRDYATGSVRLESRETAVRYRGFYELRLAPTHALDPRLRLVHATPDSLGVAASISLLLDPVVLLGGVEVSQHSSPHCTWITTTAAGGLVANQRVSYAMTASLGVPVTAVALPSSSFTFRSVIALDARQTREIVIAATMSLRGTQAWVSGRVALRGRGL